VKTEKNDDEQQPPAIGRRSGSEREKSVFSLFFPLTVGLLVSGSGAGTSELLGLVPPGIGDEERAVVADQDVLDLLLGGLVDVLLVVGHERLGDRLADRINLSDMSTAINADSDVDSGESIFSQEQDWFFQLLSERSRLDEMERSSVDFDEAVASLAMRHRRRCFLATKDLDRLKGFFLAHFFLSLRNVYIAKQIKF